MRSSVETQIRDPRNCCFSWYYKGYSALLLQTHKSSPSKSLSVCVLQAQPSHLASKHHPFGLDSWLLFPWEKEAGAGVASMCRRVVFSFCGCRVRRQGGVGRRVKKDEWEISKLTFFILKNHFKVLAPIWDGKIPTGFQRRFLQGMSADLQGDFRMWSFHMYLPKLSMEKIHLVLKGLGASWGAARSIMITESLQVPCVGHPYILMYSAYLGSLPSPSDSLSNLTYVLVERANKRGR